MNLRPALGQLKTVLYRKPKDELRRLRRWGPHAYLRLGAWQARMEAAAHQLPPVVATDLGAPPLEVWYLTGARFWYQTAFCAWTLARWSGRRLVLNLTDDGSLSAAQEQALRRLFPQGTTRWRSACWEQFQQLLPEPQYPTLHARWHDYINLHKLTAIHLGSRGPKLVLDSDMLFFARPEALLGWWDRDLAADASGELVQPCLMVDCEEAYGYSPELMRELVGVPIPPLLNVGVCGLSSEALDWAELEHWCRTLLEREGTNYYLEQALVAMLAARHSPTVLHRDSYITFPSRAQTLARQGVLQHYVADSKPWYFREAWGLACQ
ncbi:hypothetical protein [Cyanobium sp. Morenito 9A2]|uniref:hypothetical protein n=1 Tax=Cyanobium sp. Morenito 9A2 TaxID=2823718 RepID=UPI0020CC1061|nr:hypothetical protein [Cyanobium sp. Morenito 9A2]MCP9849780.1 hypothetical protein [Cyanobium sp. Morenito 9A2]